MSRPARRAVVAALLGIGGCDPLVVRFPGADGSLTAAPDPVDMGVVFVGVDSTAALTLYNPGGESVSVDLDGDGGRVLQVVVAPSSVDVPPGGSADVRIDVVAVTWGALEGVVQVRGDDGALLQSVPVHALAQVDADGDGYGSEATGGEDCDDQDAARNPGATEEWYDGVDQDCAGDDDFDADGDGVHVDVDCDDTDPAVGSWSVERWDGRDDDCDGQIDNLTIGRAASGVVYGERGGQWLGLATSLSRGVGLLGEGEPDLVFAAPWDTSGGGVWILPAGDMVGADGELDRIAPVRLDASGGDILGVLAPRLGDATGDGVDDLLVGESVAWEDAGSTRVWVVPGGEIPTRRELRTVASASVTGDSTNDTVQVAIALDLDGDGVDDLVVGAPNDQYQPEEGSAEWGTGNVSWFEGPLRDGAWSLDDAEVQIHGSDDHASLGASLTGADLDQDGYGEIFATAPGDDSGGPSAGMIYRFAGPSLLDGDARADALAVARWAGSSANEGLGLAGVPPPGDVDGDGRLDLALGSQQPGRVMLWPDAAGEEGLHAAADAPTKWELGASCGWGLTADTDLDGDGVDDLLVGCPEDASGGEYAGAVLWLDPASPAGPPRALLTGDASGDLLGSVLLGGIELPGGGGAAVLVGAPGADPGGENAGAVYLLGVR